eukprot:jgi/Astpho2/5804/fgenesh1_pg.00080_%23_57_t
MQQCHNKIVNLNDFAVSRKVFGKVHDATRDTLVILMASVAAPDAPTPFDPKEPMLASHNVVSCQLGGNYFEQQEQPPFCVIFKRHCIAKMSMIEDLCKELNSQRADVVRPCIHTFQLTQRGQSNQDRAFLQLQDTYGKFKKRIIEQEILELKPDICMLQEIGETVDFEVAGYIRLHPTEGHGPPEQQSGCNTILLRKDNSILKVIREPQVYSYGFEVILLVNKQKKLRVISGHFSSQSQELRLLQFKALMESSRQCDMSLLFGGDTNLRQTEVRDFTLPFTDVWDNLGMAQGIDMVWNLIAFTEVRIQNLPLPPLQCQWNCMSMVLSNDDAQ